MSSLSSMEEFDGSARAPYPRLYRVSCDRSCSNAMVHAVMLRGCVRWQIARVTAYHREGPLAMVVVLIASSCSCVTARSPAAADE